MASERPTIRGLEERINGVEGLLGVMASTLDRVEMSVEKKGISAGDAKRLRKAMRRLAECEGIKDGLADIAEVLSPMHRALPPSTANPLDCGVAAAIGEMREALGGDHRDLNFSSLVTRWDGPVPVIGEAVCPPAYPSSHENQEAVG